MHNPTETDSRSPPQSGGVVTRAPMGSGNDTAQPSLTSGFGAVIEKEHDLQATTEGSLGQVSGLRSTEIDRILRQHHSRLGANIALLEQRYEALPNPERFVSWQDRPHAPVATRRKLSGGETEFLPDLIARHTSLLADIGALIACAPDGQRGELILSEVSRNHEQMAWRLTALLKEREPVPRLNNEVGPARGATAQAQENWDNEGGPVSINSPAR
jgi:hypothetical protein